MGIFISAYISDSVKQSEWLPVYEKSLMMAKKLRLFDFGYRDIHGKKICCIYPTDESNEDGSTGWGVCGSFPTYKRAEYQFTPKSIGPDIEHTAIIDALMTFVPQTKKAYDYVAPTIRIWGNKTQGRPYHMDLLAIGCMIENELGVQAIVCGDITYGQCVKAAEKASEILGEDIKPPVLCRLNNLYERISKLQALTDTEKIKLLLNRYLGDKDAKLGSFIREHFSSETISEYWRNRFHGMRVGVRGFTMILKEYLMLGEGLEDLCEYSDFDKNDAEQCTTFITKILNSSLHLKSKDCSDVLDYTKSDAPYGIYDIMMPLFFMGASNPAVDRYIPLDEIRRILKKHFENAVDVDVVIDNYLSKEQDEKPSHEQLKEEVREYQQSIDESYKKYDICGYEDLVHFSPDSRIDPETDEYIRDSFNVYCELMDGEECRDLLEKTANDMFGFLADNVQGYYLAEADWDKIYSDIQRDRSSFRRFYPIVKLDLKGSSSLSYLVRAFVTDDMFWAYCCEKYK